MQQPPAAPPRAAAVFTPVAAGYGGAGPAPLPPARPPVWAVLIIDLHAASTVRDLRAASLELLAADGATVVARHAEAISLRVTPPGRDGRDLSEHGTTPLPRELPAGTRLRLRVHVRLDEGDAGVYRAAPPRYRVRFTMEGGAPVVLEGDAGGPWPTA